ncbi:MAG: hypothetical protein HZA91_10845, partial [Verrucomicrobia bacterium]|nr:hypothetical protein [Verrucomicrobiota bacterium]
MRKLHTTPRRATRVAARVAGCCLVATAFCGSGCYVPTEPSKPKAAAGSSGAAAFGWSSAKTEAAPPSTPAPKPATPPAISASKPSKGYGSTGKKSTATQAKTVQPARPQVDLFKGTPPGTNRSAVVEAPAAPPATPAEQPPPKPQSAAELAAAQPAAAAQAPATGKPAQVWYGGTQTTPATPATEPPVSA